MTQIYSAPLPPSGHATSGESHVGRWKFRSQSFLGGEWRNLKTGASGRTLCGSFGRLYSKSTNFRLAQKLDRELGLHLVDTFDYGNPVFWQEERSISRPTLYVKETGKSIISGGNTYWLDHWSGHVYPSADLFAACRDFSTGPKWVPFESDAALSTLDLYHYGSNAISQLLPSLPSASIATTLGELREGLPKVVGAALFRNRSFASLGEEYLNYQFGIAPTISDVNTIRNAARRAETQLEERVAHQKKGGIRRRRTMLDETTTSVVEKAGVYPYFGNAPTAYTVQAGVYRTHTTKRRKVWYSGTFKRWQLPYEGELLEGFRSFNRTYGVMPTALTAWNLTPYSWLVDWFTNAGDVFTNLSYIGQDGWYQRYGYVMCHTEWTVTHTWTGPVVLTPNGSFTKVTTEVVEKFEVKQRLLALPYVFGWDFDGLNDFQKTILGALGITRARTH